MENEIKVNEFVRTKDGYIGKYVKDGLRKGTIEVEDNMVSWIVDNSNILKCSKNLIDLIQCGDYVNGEIVIDVLDGFVAGTNEIELLSHKKIYRHHIEDIETIVTKEMMESISYKVKQEEN